MAKRELEIEEDRDEKKQLEEERLLLQDDTEEVEKKPAPKLDFADDGEDEPDADDADDDDARLAYSDDDDEPVERLSRRRRRNRARREQRDADQATIIALTERLAMLEGNLGQTKMAQLGMAAQDIDSQIARLQADLETIEIAQSKAVANSDDAAFREAKRLESEAQRRLMVLGGERQRLVAFARAQQAAAGAPQIDQVRPAPQADPDATRFAERFMERHQWFDPNDAADPDSNIVKAIDASLVNAGYRPNTKRFWVALESELRRRKVGHYGGDSDDGDDNMRDDDIETQRERRALPPRARATSRSAAPRTGFRLTPDMRAALEAEGLDDDRNLTDDQRKYRSRLIKTWQDRTTEARRSGALR